MRPESLARLDRRAEDVCVAAIVVSELELFDVQRQVFRADLVERADYSALNHAPEAFDGICVNVAMHIFTIPVINRAMRELSVKSAIASALVGRDQADLIGHHLTDKFAKRLAVQIRHYSGDHFPFALDCADYDGLAMPASAAGTAGSTRAAALVFVPILGLAADERFVHFYEADQF